MKSRLNEFIQSKSYIDMKSLAADLAAGDAEDQAFFFNTFFDALKVNCEDLYRFNMQLEYMLKESKHNAKLAYEYLGEIREEE